MLPLLRSLLSALGLRSTANNTPQNAPGHATPPPSARHSDSPFGKRCSRHAGRVTSHGKSGRYALFDGARPLLGLVLGLVLATATTSAAAWGAEAHRAIAQHAYEELDAATRRKVDALLRLEPGATLASIATWADEHRSPATARWHYVNIRPGTGCQYQAQRDCPDGRCAVEALKRQTALLKTAATPAERLKALKYVVHIAGDLHQPLHAGRADDKGGNLYQVQAFGRGTNLHSLWDSGMIKQEPELLSPWPVTKPSTAADLDPGLWAQESCQLMEAKGFYPSKHKIDASYLGTQRATLRKRLAQASTRLAQLITRALR